MPSPLRSAVVFTLASAFLLGLLSPACSQQGEGERCDNLRAGDSDCDSGLICMESMKLLEDITDRCCKPDGSYDDSRCTPKTGIGSSAGGTGGSAGTGGSQAGEDGQPVAGEGPGSQGGTGSMTEGGTGSMTEGGTGTSQGGTGASEGGAPAAGTGQGGAD